ncbi:MAG: phosphoesterase [Chloroflexota bacterium]|jgi:intracellular multiplication protein IcmT|nr:MAG: phosphoesterase [Chloroflexota bacterium]
MNEWRNAGKTPRILGIDARAIFPIAFWLLHMRTWTFILAMIGIAIFAVLERFGYTVPVFLRFIKHKLRGRTLHARPWWVRRRFFG